MHKYLEKIIDLLRKRPGLSAVQLSDLLDIDLDIIENIITMALRAEQLEFSEAPGGNGLTLKKYSVPGKSIDWEAPANVTSQPQIEVVVERKPAPEAASLASNPSPAEPDTRSKAEKAIAHLKEHGPTDRSTLMTVMGLDRKYAIEQYLRPHVKNGKVIRIDDVYCIPDRSVPAPEATKPEHHPACDRKFPSLCNACNAEAKVESDLVHTQPHHVSGGIELVDILRAKLTPEELRGFFKGNAIKHLLDAEDGGAGDYKQASVYAAWLAEATTQPAA